MHVAGLLLSNRTTPKAIMPSVLGVWASVFLISNKVQTWHPDVDVYFQEKVWVDTKFSCDWAKKTLKQTIPDNSKFVLFCDNLTAQCTYEFKEEVSNINGVVWYRLPSATDLW